MFGIDRLSTNPLSGTRKRLRDARVAVLTHAAAVDRKGLPLLSVLEELGVTPTVVFAPEHGLEAVAQAEEAVRYQDDTAAESMRIVSLYGDTKESLVPSAADLEGVEVLVIDLCDVGSRYYTYVWTALMAARAAADAGIHTLVLDRPNPISGDPAKCEGRPQAEGFTSFVGMERLPIRHGLSIAELLVHYFVEDGRALGPDGALSVVTTVGWERHRTATAWGRPFVMPSPNMPTLETALVYPGACLIEGTNLSEGRGTTVPFQVVGAPFLDGAKLARDLIETAPGGVQVRPVSFRPVFEKHAGSTCRGVMLHVTNAEIFRPVATYLTLVTLARAQAPDSFAFRTEPYEFEASIPAFDLLTGSAEAREAIISGASANDVIDLVGPVPPEWAASIEAAERRVLEARA